MTRPTKLPAADIDAWLPLHPGWARAGDELVREFKFSDYAATIGFVVRLGFAAEKRDHHPDLVVRWGRVEVRWSTHDAGGLTALDLEMAERTDQVAAP